MDDSSDTEPAHDYNRIDKLSWSKEELIHGKTVGIKKFPKKHKTKLFQIPISTNRTEHIVTNAMDQ